MAPSAYGSIVYNVCDVMKKVEHLMSDVLHLTGYNLVVNHNKSFIMFIFAFSMFLHSSVKQVWYYCYQKRQQSDRLMK